jgi:spermidine synthase
MIELARATSERGELVLSRRADGHLELRANGVFVMDTENTHTEKALASLALEQVTKAEDVLIGGLGLGFTTEQVLTDPRVRRVVTVEIEPALVGLMRDGTVPHGPGLLADPRLEIRIADIQDAILADEYYDLILLDVDNGPGYLVHDHNAEVYAAPFLTRLQKALGPKGVLVIWSASQEPALQAQLEAVFGNATEHAYDVQLGTRPEKYFLYLSQS